MKITAVLLTALLAAAPTARAVDNPDVLRLSQQLQALDVDPETANAAAFERLQARQALDALTAARSKDRPSLTQVAERRVEAAGIAARTVGLQREIDTLERERSDLIVEASRQEASRARQESERLRVQAQIQAEDATRLQEQATQEAAARADAETALDGVADAQTAKLKAARQREAELARREAELTGAAPAPVPVKKKGKK